jgi:hypothetical protein
MRETKDEAARKTIAERWNESLVDGALAPSQIYAFARQWDRTLLTDEFWRLLSETKNRKTLSAICYALYEQGTEEDAKKLVQKDKATEDVELRQIIVNALNWIRYKHSGDTTNPGPAARPPHME